MLWLYRKKKAFIKYDEQSTQRGDLCTNQGLRIILKTYAHPINRALRYKEYGQNVMLPWEENPQNKNSTNFRDVYKID